VIPQYHGTLASLANDHPVLGLAMQHHRNTRGLPMAFRDKPYLIELYTDGADLESWVICKAVQTGVSEWAVQLAFDRAGWNSRIAAYILPTYTIRDRFVQQRIDPLLLDVPAYAEKTPGNGLQTGAALSKKAAGNLKLKKFGGGTLMFLGSNTEGDFVEFSADLLVIDEYDQCDPANIAKARDRLRASPHPQMVRLGNPTQPRIGISKLYDESDRRRWFMRCGGCGERQAVDWFTHIVERDSGGSWVPRDKARWKGLLARPEASPDATRDIRPICTRCHEPFQRVVDGSCWVAETPGRPTRGYRMSRLDVLSDSLWKLFIDEWLPAQSSDAMLAAFYCGVLGMAFEFEGARLSVGDLEAVCTGPDVDYGGGESYVKQTVTAGVDVGSVLNVTISVIHGFDANDEPLRRAVYVGACRTFEEVAYLMRTFHVDLVVMDAGPETHKAQEFRDKFIEEGGTMVWLCRFHPTPRVGAEKYGMRLDYGAQVITCDRTAVFDVSFEDIRQRRRTFPQNAFSVFAWNEQMRAPVRILNESGRIVWQESNSPDHYRLSDVYDRIAYDLLQLGGSYSAG
jgi:hypothetical protein